MNGNAAMVESMPDNTPDDAVYDLERSMRLDEQGGEMLEALKHLLRVVGQPVTARTESGRVHLLIGFDDVNHLLRRTRALVQHIEMGDPL